jgi:hypothetical protein
VQACTDEPPVIDVTPADLSSTQLADTQVTQTLTISNTGMGDLTWAVVEQGLAVNERGQGGWSDNFDSYATGSQMHGQGGWKGWDNSPAAGALTSNAQALSAPNSVDILGGSDLVHEYSGYTSGQWIYTAWQYVPSNFAGTSYFIMLNTYSDGGSNNWSVQVQFDSTSGQLLSDNDGATLPLITGQWVEIRIEIDLDTDVQTFYYDDQMLYQKSWADGVSGGGVANIAAVDLFANNASSVFYDNISLNPPGLETCDASNDIPWATVSPTFGNTSGGSNSSVDVGFDSTGLSAGIYTGTLCIESNDVVTPLSYVPLTLAVEEPAADIIITSPEDGTVFTATNGISVTASVEVTITEGFVIPTDGHWHLWLDGTDTGPVNSYAGTVDLLVGMHVISAQLQTPDHMPLGPVDTIMVTVVTETVEPPPTDTYIYLPFVVNGSGAQAQATPTSHVAAANNDDWSVASLAMFPILVGLVIPFRRKSGYLEG